MIYCTLREIVQKIHSTTTQAVIISTGGGTDIFPMLLRRGGGSATLLEGIVPYHPTASAKLISGKIDKLVSEEAARILAVVAYERAVELRESLSTPVIGVATTSILQRTPEEREGRIHYIYCALHTTTKTVSLTLELGPDAWVRRTAHTLEEIRIREEEINAEMMLDLIAEGCGLEDRCGPADGIVRTESNLGKLIPTTNGEHCFECSYQDGIKYIPNAAKPKLLFPGSFNPAHEAHLKMATTAEEIVGRRCDFEISMTNVDKPKTDFIALENRLKSFCRNSADPYKKYWVWITNSSTFREKANAFPHTKFVVGYDTALRIQDPKYGDPYATFGAFGLNESSFLVFGRKDEAGFQCDPKKIRFRVQMVEEDKFRMDISSTEIRKGQ